MADQKLSIGRIVHYRLSQNDVDRIVQVSGNAHVAGQVVPAVVVRVWSDTCFNGQALLDGTGHLWLTSATPGDGDGQWAWPPRV